MYKLPKKGRDDRYYVPEFLTQVQHHQMISGGFGYLIGWFVGGTSCTLQTLYAWLMRGFGIGMVGILIIIEISIKITPL